jgi:alanine racemase
MSNTWIELDLEALADNIRNVRAALTRAAEIIFVVKSDAYGHGLAPVARQAWQCGLRWFAVAHIGEALRLRELLPEARILVMGVLAPEEIPAALAARLLPVVVSAEHGLALAAAAAAQGQALACHAKVDTGMGRLGFAWETAADALAALARRGGLALQGICTHLASADEPETDFAETQAERFRQVVLGCAERGLPPLFKHLANSGGVLRDVAWDLDGVRLGILLYGYGPRLARAGSAPGEARRARGRAVATRPLLHWKTRVVQVKTVPARFPVSYGSTHVTERETILATVNAGYADGYRRALGNRGAILIGGRRCPVVGRVTMNLTVADAGPDAAVRVGDEATLLGTQGGEAVWAEELAALCGTISYEVLTSIRTDVRRIKGG